jgi:hypothetical protein
MPAMPGVVIVLILLAFIVRVSISVIDRRRRSRRVQVTFPNAGPRERHLVSRELLERRRCTRRRAALAFRLDVGPR